MGRNAKPIGLHLAEGNPNRLTKAEIEARQAAEVKLGEQDLTKLKRPPFVAKDKTASKYWMALIKEYTAAAKQGVELLTSSDVGMLALYCKTYSEYESLCTFRQRLHEIEAGGKRDISNLIERIEEITEIEAEAIRHLNTLAALTGILNVENAINKKMDMLLKMQDRLFLNPLAKVKNVPKPKDDKKESAMAKFMSRRAGGHGT